MKNKVLIMLIVLVVLSVVFYKIYQAKKISIILSDPTIQNIVKYPKLFENKDLFLDGYMEGSSVNMAINIEAQGSRGKINFIQLQDLSRSSHIEMEIEDLMSNNKYMSSLIDKYNKEHFELARVEVRGHVDLKKITPKHGIFTDYWEEVPYFKVDSLIFK